MVRKWILMLAITSAAGCATLSEPEYPHLGNLQTPPTPAEPATATTPPTALGDISPNRPLTAAPPAEEPAETPIAAQASTTDLRDPLSDLFYTHYKEWRGTRYRLGGLSKAGIDCSGFVYLTFLDRLGVELPRSTHYQVQRGQDVNRNSLQTGDLVFFRNGRVNHVGIYLEDDKFMHSSTRSGVRISSLSNSYWKRSYWKAKRLNLPDPFTLAQNP